MLTTPATNPQLPLVFERHLLGHRVVSIKHEGLFIDASRDGNIALFPYKGLHTLRLIQFIAVAIIAILAAIVTVSALALTCGLAGLPLIAFMGPLLLVGGGGGFLVHKFNHYDPTAAASQRHHLLDNHISAPSSPYLTDAEKALNIARDRRLSPQEVFEHYRELTILSHNRSLESQTEALLNCNLSNLTREQRRAIRYSSRYCTTLKNLILRTADQLSHILPPQ